MTAGGDPVGGRSAEVLLAIVDALSTGPDPDDIATRVADLLIRTTSADRCTVWVLDNDDHTLRMRGTSPPEGDAVGPTSVPLGEGIPGWVTNRWDSYVGDAVRAAAAADSLGSGVPLDGSYVVVPISTRTAGLSGVIAVSARPGYPFSAEETALVTEVARLVAGAVQVARAHERLAVRQAMLERMARDVLGVQERERARMAADIHDGVAQRIVSLSFHLAAALDGLPPGASFAAEQLAVARRIAELALEETRAAVQGLRPPVLDDLGLAQALESLVRSVPDLAVSVRVAPCSVPDYIEIAIYRITQEALQNAVKHAGARSVTVELRCTAEGLLSLVVSDDGDGLPDPAVEGNGQGYGLTTMRERAELVGGRLEIWSRPGRGTRLAFHVELDRPPGG